LFRSPQSSGSRGSRRFPLPRPPSPCPARYAPSPQFHGPKSKKYLLSASETACPDLAAAAVRSCPPHPSVHQSALPTWLRHSVHPAPTVAPPAHRPREICSSSAARELPAPPGPAVRHRPPSHTCSVPPRCTALPPDAPAARAPASAASDRRSPPPPESLHPSAPHP